jgi:hypothetical protein
MDEKTPRKHLRLEFGLILISLMCSVAGFLFLYRPEFLFPNETNQNPLAQAIMKIEIESDTTWKGGIAYTVLKTSEPQTDEIVGGGNMTYIYTAYGISIVVQKQTDYGYLRVKIDADSKCVADKTTRNIYGKIDITWLAEYAG